MILAVSAAPHDFLCLLACPSHILQSLAIGTYGYHTCPSLPNYTSCTMQIDTKLASCYAVIVQQFIKLEA